MDETYIKVGSSQSISLCFCPNPSSSLTCCDEMRFSLDSWQSCESLGVRLDELDRTVEAFGAGIADPMTAVVEQARLMASSISPVSPISRPKSRVQMKYLRSSAIII